MHYYQLPTECVTCRFIQIITIFCLLMLESEFHEFRDFCVSSSLIQSKHQAST